MADHRTAVMSSNFASPEIPDEQKILDLIRTVAHECDCLLIIPPFASVDRPALGPHILQQMARLQGLSVATLYANLIFANLVGLTDFEQTCDKTNRSTLLGERLFARLAHGLAPFGLGADEAFSQAALDDPDSPGPEDDPLAPGLTVTCIEAMERKTDQFCDLLARGLAACDCRIVGVSTSFEQTNAAIAIIKALKQRKPSTVTLLGGANCEGAMAHAMLSLASGAVDFVFAGESECTFPETLKKILRHEILPAQVIEGSPCQTLDHIPAPDYSTFFHQLQMLLPGVDPGRCWLAYESSRGCWWGQKHHCTFCGLNGEGMDFRQKSSAKVLAEIQMMVNTYPTRWIAMADNIMPHSYHRSLIPDLQAAGFDGAIFYEQKANLSFHQVTNLRKAGVAFIQPGIESLATPVLKLMKKGVSAGQNIALLRYGRINDVSIAWNLLAEFPGDSAGPYREMLAALPRLRHLHPPNGVSSLSVDRFSPYFDHSASYGVTNVRPWPSYFQVFPDYANVPGLAYHFQADYESGSRNEAETMQGLRDEVKCWRQAWMSETECPMLAVSQVEENTFVLIDTRSLENPQVKFLTRTRAYATLCSGSLSAPDSTWAISNGYALALDGRCVPLATASNDLLTQIEADVAALPLPVINDLTVLSTFVSGAEG
jgi:ribosomal peptide maturation radical SAM protein 1